MEFSTYSDAADFLGRTQHEFEAAEAANSLIYGIALRIRDNQERITKTPYMATVTHGEKLLAAAVQTPPYRIIVYGKGENLAALRLIANDLMQRGAELPGVVGEVAAAAEFAELWEDMAGATANTRMRQRLFELRRVIPPRPVSGKLRLANTADIDLAAQWFAGFYQDADLDEMAEDMRPIAEMRIKNGELFLWQDREAVSMAGKTRPLPHGIAIGPVYTPPEQRGRGYASALVAALSQHLLDSGYKFCTLFTDLANPTANKIYQAIGYRPVADFDAINFT